MEAITTVKTPQTNPMVKRVKIWISNAHRARLNAAAKRDGLGQQQALEALIDAYADGRVGVTVETLVKEKNEQPN